MHGLKHALLFLHVQLFPFWQSGKVIFADPKYVTEVGVREVFLETNRHGSLWSEWAQYTRLHYRVAKHHDHNNKVHKWSTNQKLAADVL